ncbi:MAG: FKBP-type peptidyl-prolyl cis-trans isomerase [Hyphococcus sp.]
MNTTIKAESGHRIEANFVVRTNDGVLVSEGPQKFTLGKGETFQAIEDAITGMGEGEEKQFTLHSADAFGPRREDLTFQIPRSELPSGETPEKGMQLGGKNDRGETVRLLITDVDDNAVTVDGNHPLAGLDLQIALTVTKITDAE